jgi:hypothetical protein
LLGLVGLFSFAFVYMQEASRIFTLGSGMLLSTLFSYITRDEKYFAYEEKSLDSFVKLVDYTLSKNIFTILFIGLLFFVVFIIGRGLYSLGFTNKVFFDLEKLALYALLVLGIENIFSLLKKRISSPMPVAIKEILPRILLWDLIIIKKYFLHF